MWAFFLEMKACKLCFILFSSFLQSIREVGGYVLIAMNEVATIPLVNLRLIRGQTLYEGQYALLVMSNYNKNHSSSTPDYTSGLKQLQLSSLSGTHRNICITQIGLRWNKNSETVLSKV